MQGELLPLTCDRFFRLLQNVVNSVWSHCVLSSFPELRTMPGQLNLRSTGAKPASTAAEGPADSRLRSLSSAPTLQSAWTTMLPRRQELSFSPAAEDIRLSSDTQE